MLNSQQIYSHLRVFIEGVNNLLHIGTEGIVNLTRKQDDFSGSNQLAALSSCTPVIDSLAKSLITNLLPPNYGEETLTRIELGELFNVSHEAIRLWEESGKLIELGWDGMGWDGMGWDGMGASTPYQKSSEVQLY